MKPNDDILEITLAFQRGEERGFEYFYKLHYADLKYYAFRFLKDKMDADDKVENSFIKIWKLHSGFYHPRVIKQWLYTTVRNECLNHLADTKYRDSTNKELAVLRYEPEPDKLKMLIKSEVYKEVISYLRFCPPQCREIMKLIFIEGLNTPETADRLNVSKSCVKTQKARGLEIIRARLNVTKQQYLDNCNKLVERIRNSDLGDAALARLYNIDAARINHLRHNLTQKIRLSFK